MNRPGQPSRPSNRPNSSTSSDRPSWKSNTRLSTASDDERQYSRKASGTSSYGPYERPASASGPGNIPTTDRREIFGSTPQAYPSRAGFSSAQSRTSSGYRTTPSSPYRSGPRKGPLAEPTRSNPTAPVWDAGPNRPRGVGFNTQRTPNRNPGYVSAPSTLRGPGRKAASTAPPMWNPTNEPQSLKISRMTPTPRKRPPIEIVKSTNFPKPFWQHQDDEHEARQKVERRMTRLGESGQHTTPSKQSSAQPRRAYLSPTLQIVKDPPSDDDGEGNQDKDSHAMEVDDAPQKNIGVKTIQPRSAHTGMLANRKAARKTKWLPPPEESSEDDSSSSSSSSFNSIIDLSDTESGPGNGPAGHASKPEEGPLTENEIVIVEQPQPVITISLPQITPVNPRLHPLDTEPPESLVAALDEVCLPSIRMQKTRQLPFLLRNLRRGFRLRCNSIGTKTTRSRPKMPVVVQYEYMESIFVTHMSKWLCPLCELHGVFPNKEMLRCHLHWDHSEVILERWEQRTNNQGRAEWRVHILVPEVIYESIKPREFDIVTKLEPREVSVGPGTYSTPTPSAIRGIRKLRLSSALLSQPPLPVRTSPPAPSIPTLEPSVEPSPDPRDATPGIDSKQNLFRNLDSLEPPVLKTLYPERREDFAARWTSTTPSWTNRSRSLLTSTTERTNESPSTVRIEHTPGPAGGLYPSPPPVHDPLGPAAQYPYLPARSQNGGPDIHYSCRPGGPSTFDLLGTLPLEPFGVLEWDVLEREEEIYESDDVKVEYKVMHALWLRWMMLHRATFMQNYYKGTLAFINEHWRMIHQAAGWRAMRHWLLGLLAHRFLTIHEVARALKHYESLTGMSFW